MSFGFNLFGDSSNESNRSSSLLNTRTWKNTDRAVVISEAEFDQLRQKLVGQGDYNFLESEVRNYATRRDQIIKEIEANLNKLEDANDDKEAFVEIEASVARNEGIRPGPDEALFARPRAEVMEAPNRYREEDERLRKKKIEIGMCLERVRKELKNYVLHELKMTFVYEESNNYYKLGTGSTSLVQPAAEELRTVGVDFRRLLTNEKKLRTLTFEQAKEIISRYQQAATPNHPDYASITSVMTALYDNTAMPRLAFLSRCRSLCDKKLAEDLESTLQRICQDPFGRQDLQNSMDETECFLQLSEKDRLPEQRQEAIKRKLKPILHLFSAEKRAKYNLQDYHDSNRGQGRGGRNRRRNRNRGNWENSERAERNTSNNRGNDRGGHRGRGRGRGGRGRGGRGGFIRSNPRNNNYQQKPESG